MTIPVLYTPEEVAEKLKTTRRTVYRWLLKGKLRGLRAGDTWRIAEQDLMGFLESRKAPAPRVGPKHPHDAARLAYFQRQPVKRGKGARK